MTSSLRFLSATVFCLSATTSMFACDSDGDEGSESAESAEHGETHSGTGMESDEASMLEWQASPPAAIAAGTPFAAEFTITTTGEIHVSEIRVCAGVDVMDCGLGDMTSFDESFPAPLGASHYSAEVTLESAGEYTIVAFAHIGANPHISDAHNIVVE